MVFMVAASGDTLIGSVFTTGFESLMMRLRFSGDLIDRPKKYPALDIRDFKGA